MSNSQPAYPVTTPLGGQNSVVSVVVGSVDSSGNFVAANSTTGLPISGGGGGGGGGAVTVADGADATQGLIADAVVAAGAAGTVSAKLRRLTTDIGTLATASPTYATTTLQTAGNTSLATLAANVGTVTPTDASGKITTGGTAQVLSATNAARRGYWVQNLSTGDLWLNEQGTAAISASTPQSFKLPANAYYESPVNGAPTEAISIIGATTGQQFAARTW